jgi:hypothetical protein
MGLLPQQAGYLLAHFFFLQQRGQERTSSEGRCSQGKKQPLSFTTRSEDLGSKGSVLAHTKLPSNSISSSLVSKGRKS